MELLWEASQKLLKMAKLSNQLLLWQGFLINFVWRLIACNHFQ